MLFMYSERQIDILANGNPVIHAKVVIITSNFLKTSLFKNHLDFMITICNPIF
jgi:hypothetical protein